VTATVVRHPLRERAFARLWSAGFLAEVGQWMLLLVLPLYVFQLTGSALITSAVAMLGLLPSLVAGPLAGGIADRWDQRTVLVAVSVGQAAALVPLLFVHDTHDLWLLYAVTAVEAALAAMFESVKNVALVTLVSPDQLTSANASIGLNATMGRLIGSPVGGLLLGLTGIPSVVALGIVTFLAAAVLAMAIPPRTDRGRSPERLGFWQGLGQGLTTIWRTPTLRGVTTCVSLLAMAQGMFVVLFLLFVTDLLRAGETEAGVLRGVQAIGGFAGTMTAGLLTRRLGNPRLLATALLVFGLISATTWNLPLVSVQFWLYAALFVAAGVPGVWLAAAWLSLVQQASTPTTRGRVMGTVLGLSDGFQALGMLAAGLLASVVPTVLALDVQAMLVLLAALLCTRTLAVRRPHRRDRGSEPPLRCRAQRRLPAQRPG
jgi:MFS family permease